MARRFSSHLTWVTHDEAGRATAVGVGEISGEEWGSAEDCPRTPGSSHPKTLYNGGVIIQRSRGSWPADAPPTDR
jgi:hypothetical protein